MSAGGGIGQRHSCGGIGSSLWYEASPRMRSVFTLTLAVFALVAPDLSHAASARIGVLAYRGYEYALQRWTFTADYLSLHLGDVDFEIVPLDLEDMDTAVYEGSIDFVLTNPGNYVALEAEYGTTRIATLQNCFGEANLTRFGAVIFARRDRADLRELGDLRGWRFMAVSREAFGGFQMAWKAFNDHGIDPASEFAELRYVGFPQDQIVHAVLRGDVDAGTVRSDTLERMAAEGVIRLEDLRILNPQSHRDFPFQVSTSLYPEWPIARLGHTPKELAKRVAQALLAMPPGGGASTAVRWTIPLDYTPVHQLLSQLRIPPYDRNAEVSPRDVLRHYGYWLLAAVVVFAGMWAMLAYGMRANRNLSRSQTSLFEEIQRRNRAQAELSRERDNLERRVAERTGELQKVNEALASDIEARKEAEHTLSRNQVVLRRVNELMMTQGLTHDERLRRLLALGCDYLGMSAGFLLIAHPDRFELCAAQCGGRLRRGEVFPRTLCGAADVVRSAALVERRGALRCAEDDPRRVWKAYLGLPVFAHGRIHCVLEFASTAPRDMPVSSMARDVAGLMAQWVGSEIERQQADEQARQHQLELAHVARLSTLGEMASGLAHELNQPLTAVVNYTSGCLRRLESGHYDPAELAKAMRHAVEGASHASEIVRHLRDLVRKGDASKSEMDLNRAVTEVLDLVAREIDRHRVGLELDLHAGELTLRANRVQIEQVILNLVMNAIEALASGSVQVPRVTVSTRVRSDGRVELSVVDNGPGIDDSQRDALFEPFYTTKTDGIGMGLTISRTIVESHGGRLEVESREGQGAGFTFILPISGED